MLWPTTWKEYELLDSGDGQRLERFGPYRLARPDPNALWAPHLPADAWQAADAFFDGARDEQPWVTRRHIAEPWAMAYDGLQFEARLTPFKHTGLFPEQAVNWEWCAELIRARVAQGGEARVLNLFAYTGLASLSAALAGAQVTHVDASRPAMNWARANQRLSGLEQLPIRWLIDDVLKFVRREVRRENVYEGIILDPPAFGRGPKGEIWRFSEGYPELMRELASLISPQPLFLLVNAYAITESALVLRNVLEQTLGDRGGMLEAGELALRESGPGGRLLPTSLFARWAAETSREGA